LKHVASHTIKHDVFDDKYFIIETYCFSCIFVPLPVAVLIQTDHLDDSSLPYVNLIKSKVVPALN